VRRFCSRFQGCRDDLARAVPILVDGLSDTSAKVRSLSVYALAVARQSGALREHIARLASDEDDSVRASVAVALASMPLDDEVERIFSDALCDPIRDVRERALRSVAALGPDGARFLEAVQRNLEFAEASERASAASTWSLDSDSRECVAGTESGGRNVTRPRR
jgi:HEAT repeat protein